MRAERRALLRDLSEIAEAEHLKTAAVREDGTVPVHELVQTSRLAHKFHARSEEEMIGIAEDDPRTKIVQLVGRDTLDGRLCTHGHEDGCRKTAVRCVNHARARTRRLILPNQFIGNRRQSYTPHLKTSYTISQKQEIFKTGIILYVQVPHAAHASSVPYRDARPSRDKMPLPPAQRASSHR